MSRSGGAVAVSVQVPVVGTVVGKRSISDIIAGTAPKPPAEGPAVTVRDLDARSMAILHPSAKPGPIVPDKPEPSPVAVSSSTDNPAPSTVKPTASVGSTASTGSGDPEAKATTLLQMADNFIRVGMTRQAKEKLKEVIEKYPDTEAAKEAKAKLAKLVG